jgi:hypothetical protein
VVQMRGWFLKRKRPRKAREALRTRYEWGS